MHSISDWITVSNGSEVFTEDKSSIKSPIVFWKLIHFNPIRTKFIYPNLIYPNHIYPIIIYPNLIYPNLIYTKLIYPYLFLESQLPETHLAESHLPESHLSESHLHETHLPESHLPESHLPETHLPESHLPESHLPETHLPESHLAESHLPKSKLTKFKHPESHLITISNDEKKVPLNYYLGGILTHLSSDLIRRDRPSIINKIIECFLRPTIASGLAARSDFWILSPICALLYSIKALQCGIQALQWSRISINAALTVHCNTVAKYYNSLALL